MRPLDQVINKAGAFFYKQQAIAVARELRLHPTTAPKAMKAIAMWSDRAAGVALWSVMQQWMRMTSTTDAPSLLAYELLSKSARQQPVRPAGDLMIKLEQQETGSWKPGTADSNARLESLVASVLTLWRTRVGGRAYGNSMESFERAVEIFSTAITARAVKPVTGYRSVLTQDNDTVTRGDLVTSRLMARALERDAQISA